MNALWKHNQAWIFYEPVNPDALHIPDYFDIIKNPMDLGTIKQKLSSNQYMRINEFIIDINLMFDNCILYNGETAPVSLRCKEVRDEYQKLYQQFCLDFYQ